MGPKTGVAKHAMSENAVAGGESASMRNLVMGSIQQSAEAEIHASPPSTPDVRTITNYITLPGYLRVAK